MSAENDSPEQVLEVFGTVDTLPPAMSPADCQRELAQRFPDRSELRPPGAEMRRADGGPPIRIVSDGSVF